MASAWGSSWGAAWGNSWGAGDVAPPAVIVRHGADDPRHRESDWERQRREIIERAWAIAHGEIDPVTLEPTPPPIPVDLTAINAALANIQEAQDRQVIEAFVAEQMKRLEDEAMAVLLLA